MFYSGCINEQKIYLIYGFWFDKENNYEWNDNIQVYDLQVKSDLFKGIGK